MNCSTQVFKPMQHIEPVPSLMKGCQTAHHCLTCQASEPKWHADTALVRMVKAEAKHGGCLPLKHTMHSSHYSSACNKLTSVY